MPTGDGKPSLIQLPRERLRLEWKRAKLRLQDFVGYAPAPDAVGRMAEGGHPADAWMVDYRLFSYKWLIVRKPNPRPKLALFSMGRVAQALHTQVFTAFAEYVVRARSKPADLKC
jgi:hypothetical protein